jgi:hypothetical protein
MKISALTPVMGLLLLAVPAIAKEKKELPRLNWDKPVVCAEDDRGNWVRMQCDENAPGGSKCLVAPNQREDGGELRRVKGCDGRERYYYRRLKNQGVRMIPALPEAPVGWYRDEKGRVFQITFDLLKRFYLGVGWLPGFGLDEGSAQADRVRFDMGLMASWMSTEHRNRHTIHALEGFVVLEDLEASGVLFAYDLSHASTTPLMRITTFFGKPTRHDMFMDIGFGFSLGDLHVHPHRVQELIELEFAEVHAAWDIFQSADLYNHLRLVTGVGVGGLWDDRGDVEAGYFLLPKIALQTRFNLDWEGFHYLFGDVHAAMPVLLSGDEVGETRSRAGPGLPRRPAGGNLPVGRHPDGRGALLLLGARAHSRGPPRRLEALSCCGSSPARSSSCWAWYRSMRLRPMISPRTKADVPSGSASIRLPRCAWA